MADEKIFIEIDVSTKEAQNSVESLTNDIVANENATKKLQETNRRLAKAQKQNTKEYKENAQLIALNKAELVSLNNQRKQAIKSINTTNNSYGAMKIRLKEVTQQIDRVDLSTEKGRQSVKRLREEQARLNSALKSGEAAGNSFTRNVGNYENAISSVSPGLGGMIAQIRGLTTASLAFIATPLGAVLAAITAAIGSVVAFFKRTEDGGDKLAVAIAYVTGAFEALLDIVSAIGRLLVSEVIATVEQAGAKFTIMGEQINQAVAKLKIAYSTLTRDTEGVKKAQKELLKSQLKEAKAVGKLTALIAQQDKERETNLETLKETTTAIGEKIDKTVTQTEAERELQKYIKDNTVIQEEYNRQIFEGLKIAKDEALSFEERRKGLKQAGDAELAQAKIKEEIARREFEIAEERSKINDSNLEDLQAVEDAEAKYIAAQTASLRVQTKIQATRITLDKQEEAANKRDEKRLLKAADLEDKLAIKKEEAAIAELTNLEEIRDRRFGLAEEEYKLAVESLNRQKLDKETHEASLNNLNFEYAQRNKEINKDYEESRREEAEATAKEQEKLHKEDVARKKSGFAFANNLLSSGFSIAQTFAKKNEKLQKTIAITQAVVNTALGITKAFATLPYPAAIPAAIQVAATGAAQIATIATADSGASTQVPNTATNTNNTANTSNIDQQLSQEEALREAIANIGVSVSVSEINDTQNQVSIAEAQASI